MSARKSSTPWSIAGRTDDGKYLRVVSEDGSLVALVPAPKRGAANDAAYLIASAPGLYRTHNSVRRWIERHPDAALPRFITQQVAANMAKSSGRV